MDKIKLTKKAISDFVEWSTSKYNEYRKEQIVDIIYNSFLKGVDKIFEASYGSYTENNRYGHNCQGTYSIDPVNRTITQTHTTKSIAFYVPDTLSKEQKPNRAYYIKGDLKLRREKRSWFKEFVKIEKWIKVTDPTISTTIHSGRWIKCSQEESKNFNDEVKKGLLIEHDGFLNLTYIRIPSATESE